MSVATMSEKLTRIETAVDRIRVATDTTGEVIENVASAVENKILLEEKDVNYYDYDGTLVHSYTVQEFANLTSEPTNPTREGLIAQGWNWDLSDAKAYAQKYGKLDIGQMYKTDDDKLRIYLKIQPTLQTIKIGIYFENDATFDWGDGNVETVTGSGFSTIKETTHQYTNIGDYVIKIYNSGKIKIGWPNNPSSPGLRLINDGAGNSGSLIVNNVYKIELSSNIELLGGAFSRISGLEKINLPKEITNLGFYGFYACSNLSFMVIPTGVTSISSYCFYSCTSFKNYVLPNTITTIGTSSYESLGGKTGKRITMPETLTSLGTNSFKSANFTEMIIPSSVTTFDNYCFNSNNYCYIYDFTHYTSIPSVGSSIFYSIQAYTRIIVPDALYEDWIATSGWDTYASYIVKASEA